MGASIRCPYCGATGATRTESLCRYEPPRPAAGPPVRGRLVSQTDRYECEVCKRAWDEVAYPRAAAETRVPVEAAG
jgi:hypothetical protein